MFDRHMPRRTRLALTRLERRIVPATFTVTNADNAGTGSLRQAILNANAAAGADDIAFDAAFFAIPRTITLTAVPGQLSITDDLVVNGPGPALLTVSGGGVTRVFNVDNPARVIDVTISGLTVTGGNPTSGDGGGIKAADENLTLNDLVVTGNATGATTGTIGGGGGGVAVPFGALTVRNSTISGNTAGISLNVGGYGGGISMRYARSLLLENSTVAGNTAVSRGGGILFSGNTAAGEFTIRNSTISGNTANGDFFARGGGIYARSAGTTIRNSTIVDNTAQIGGGLWLYAPVQIQNSTITGNTATTTSSYPSHGGGGLSLGFGTGVVNVESSIVSGNTAANGRDDIAAVATATVNVNFSAIGDPDGFTPSGTSGNNLPFGTALLLLPRADNGGPTQTIALGLGSPAVGAGANPAALTTDQRGPGFPRVVGAAADIGAFEGTVDAPSVSAGPFANVTTGGGTTYTFTATFSGTTPIDVSTLDDNDVQVTGPNGFNQLATFVSVTPSGNGSPRTATYSITAPGGAFTGDDTGNYAVDLQSGQVANTSGGTTPPTTLGTFRVLIPQTFTVTNLNDSGAGSLRQALQSANAAVDAADFVVFQAGLSGTITLTSGELRITDHVTINGPGASVLSVSGGGAVRVLHVSNDPASSVIAVAISGLTITGGRVTETAGGGGIFCRGNLTLDRVVISGNTAAPGGGGYGGGGGGVFGGGVLTVRNSTISGNTAGTIGQIYGGTGGGIQAGVLLLENSTVSGNVAYGQQGGGGVYYYATTNVIGVTIRNSTITGNSAVRGGGVSLRSGVTSVNAVASIQNSTITGNTATTTSSYLGWGGGGIAVFRVGATVNKIDIASSIVSGNVAANGRDDIAAAAESTVNVNFSAVGNPDGFIPSASSGDNLPFGTALYLGTLANNGGPTQTVSIDSASPARNAGSNPAALTTDQRGPGFARSSGGGVDIGAFEFQVAAPPQVSGVAVNAGQANAVQRSRVTSIVVTFDSAVTFAGAVGNAFTLMRNGGGSVNVAATANIVGGVTVVTINGFTGAEVEFGSLRDGRYTLTVLASQISAGGQQMASNFTFGDAQGLYRFYGDMNGDRRVDISDFGFFSLAYLTPANYNAALDFNNDGRIDIADFGQFSVRFFTSLP